LLDVYEFSLLLVSLQFVRVALAFVLKMFVQRCFLVISTLDGSNGKLLIYASRSVSNKERLKSVSVATEKMATSLNLSFEVVTLGEKIAPIYIYYKNGGEEPIPLYCDRGGKVNVQDVCVALRNMMFVLSFHPKHLALKQMRKEITQFS
jgi:hypothetical protein